MASKKKDRKQEILDLILESVDNKSATTAPMKKLFTKKKLDEIVEYVYEILWDEKFNPDGFFSDVLNGFQQFYILISDDMEETYFVDTQGYKYARYVSFIENLPETFFIDKVA